MVSNRFGKREEGREAARRTSGAGNGLVLAGRMGYATFSLKKQRHCLSKLYREVLWLPLRGNFLLESSITQASRHSNNLLR